MSAASQQITPVTQELLAVSAEEPVESAWKRGLKRLFAPECRWHRSSKGYGYSAVWVVVSASDGWIGINRAAH